MIRRLGVALCVVAVVSAWVGCSRPELSEAIEHRVFVDDLLLTGESIGLIDGHPTAPKYSPHTRAMVEVPPEGAILAYDARITRRGEDPRIGPVEIAIHLDGTEVVRRRMEARKAFEIRGGYVSLDEYAGRTIAIELFSDTTASREGTGFYWHRAVVERVTTVERRPSGQGRNLLFVVVDTLRADHTSLYGYERPTTPTLEALAPTSLVFDQAFAPASWTLPSTVTLFTGLAPPAHGIVGAGHHLALRHETLAERLAAGGITTFGASANPLIGPGLSFEQGFETFSHQPWERADALHDSFLDWLDQANEHRWFAYLHYIDPHDPYDAPSDDLWRDPDYDGAFEDPELLNKLYHTVNWGVEPPVEVDERDLQYLRDAYDGEIRYWDARFGELLAALEARGVLDDTIVVVTSDHGEEFLDHGHYKHGHQLFDESLRVPLLIHAPGMVEPGRRDTPVSLQGLFRTVLQLMRMGPPARDDDLLRPPTALPLFAHTRVQVSPDDAKTRFTVSSVRDGRWLLIHNADVDGTRLFDLDEDPEQRQDVAAVHPDVTSRLRQLLTVWQEAEAAGRTVEPPADVDPEALEQLRALGYVQ